MRFDATVAVRFDDGTDRSFQVEAGALYEALAYGFYAATKWSEGQDLDFKTDRYRDRPEPVEALRVCATDRRPVRLPGDVYVRGDHVLIGYEGPYVSL